LNFESSEQLNTKAQQIKLLEEECKSMKENNDYLTNQFEQLNPLVDSLRKANQENYKLIELPNAEKEP
jgi:flagellar biosynthesis/type III secretory pathway chaperone